MRRLGHRARRRRPQHRRDLGDYSGDQVNAGTYYVTAHYAGDANHEPSDGAAVAIVINKAASVDDHRRAMGRSRTTPRHTRAARPSSSGPAASPATATSVTYTGDQVNAGTYYVTAHYAGDANHESERRRGGRPSSSTRRHR